MDHKIVEVSPKQLRFTQDSIADHFILDDGEFLLDDALRELRLGRLHAGDFPPIAVATDEDGVLWSNDNRRLWLFRQARVEIIKVKLYSRALYRAPPERHLRELMAREDYFPRVRWRNGQRPSIRTLRNLLPLQSKAEQESENATPYPFASEKMHEAVQYVEPHLREVMAGGGDYFPRIFTQRNPSLRSKVEQVRQPTWSPPSSTSSSERPSRKDSVIIVTELMLRMRKMFGEAER